MQTVIDNYIITCPLEVQEILNKFRETIQKAAPNAQEKLSYGMPTFYINENLVHFAACKSHVGFYPTPSAIEAFKTELSMYKCSKGAIQFPYNQDIPYDLVAQIVAFRVIESGLKNKAWDGI